MITKDNNLKVIEFFFIYPERKFHLRELERLTKLSLPGIKKIIQKLEKEKLIESRKEKMYLNINASRNQKFVDLKRSYNIYSLSELTKYLREIYEEPEAIIIFGSYSKGEDISTSDIDIAIVTQNKKELNLSLFEKKLKRKINIYEIQLKKIETSFKDSLINGITLYGQLQLK